MNLLKVANDSPTRMTWHEFTRFIVLCLPISILAICDILSLKISNLPLRIFTFFCIYFVFVVLKQNLFAINLKDISNINHSFNYCFTHFNLKEGQQRLKLTFGNIIINCVITFVILLLGIIGVLSDTNTAIEDSPLIVGLIILAIALYFFWNVNQAFAEFIVHQAYQLGITNITNNIVFTITKTMIFKLNEDILPFIKLVGWALLCCLFSVITFGVGIIFAIPFYLLVKYYVFNEYLERAVFVNQNNILTVITKI